MSSADELHASLLRLLERTMAASGRELFAALVLELRAALDVEVAFVAECVGSDRGAATRARTLALASSRGVLPNFEYELDGTPCAEVARGGRPVRFDAARATFPTAPLLAEHEIEGFVGAPLLARDGEVIGHLALLDRRPRRDDETHATILRILAARAAIELERLRAEERSRVSERRFRDLFEEAPIAYVYEDTDTRFVSANRAALELLGLRPDQVPGLIGRTLLAPTSETQGRVAEAFADIQRGVERKRIELELRRKDNGQPVWVQFWSRPEPDGLHTRTMLIDITDRVLAERERDRLLHQNRYLQEEIRNAFNFEEIVGNAPALGAVLAQVERVAPTDSTVLLLGETGTGKELIARAIHNASRRSGRPLIKLNCAALPTGLIESELFGHEKGAFTGALERRVGRFALADGGTILLDEIGDVPPELQVRLLRVLQEKEFEPVGSARSVRVDVRVIAASNRDLRRAVEEGTFREDLFYRLNVFPIRLPPLRERMADLPLLAHYFVARYAGRIGKSFEGIAPASLERMLAYRWPGNIRELENLIERAVILSPGPLLEVEASALDTPSIGEPRDPAGRRRRIVAALERSGWVIEGPGGAARELGLHPNTLRSRMKKLGLRRPQR